MKELANLVAEEWMKTLDEKLKREIIKGKHIK